MFIDGVNLSNSCDRLAALAEDPADNREQIADLLAEFFRESGLKVLEVAEALGITDQTIYRWLRGEAKPKSTYMRRLKLLVDEKLAGQPQPPPRALRIGIPPFWDSAIITAFVQGFASQRIEPEFVRVPATHGDVHRAFRSGKIDIAVHNHFLVQYDHALKRKNQSDALGLSIRYPFFVFSGYYVYVKKDYVQRVVERLSASSPAAEPLSKLLKSEYHWSTASKGERETGMKALLKDAYVGVERYTGMELALWSAYHQAGLTFETDAHINFRNDTGSSLRVPLNSLLGGAAQLDTNQAMKAFEEGAVDIFCGGLAQHRYLQRHTAPRTQRADDSARDLPLDYLVLMEPSHVRVSAYCGIVAPPSVDEEIVQAVASVWQGCIRMFLRWNSDIIDPDRKRSSLALSQLAAMLRIVESFLPEDLRLLSTDLTLTAQWRRWLQDLPAGAKPAELTQAAVEYYRQDWRERVREWMDLMTTHCQFLDTPGEARAVFAKRHNQYGQEWGDLLYKQMEHMAEDLVKRRYDRPSEVPAAQSLTETSVRRAY